jgi:hypothetical protein
MPIHDLYVSVFEESQCAWRQRNPNTFRTKKQANHTPTQSSGGIVLLGYQLLGSLLEKLLMLPPYPSHSHGDKQASWRILEAWL